MSEFVVDQFVDEVAYYFDSHFKYHHKKFIRSNQMTRWCLDLWNKEPKEASQIIYRAFYLYRLYESK